MSDRELRHLLSGHRGKICRLDSGPLVIHSTRVVRPADVLSIERAHEQHIKSAVARAPGLGPQDDRFVVLPERHSCRAGLGLVAADETVNWPTSWLTFSNDDKRTRSCVPIKLRRGLGPRRQQLDSDARQMSSRQAQWSWPSFFSFPFVSSGSWSLFASNQTKSVCLSIGSSSSRRHASRPNTFAANCTRLASAAPNHS